MFCFCGAGWISRIGSSREDVVVLQNIFANMSSIEQALHVLVKESANNVVTKQDLHAFMKHEGTHEIGNAEIDYIFEIFDLQNDGLIYDHEIGEVISRARSQIANLHTQRGPRPPLHWR